MASYNLRVLLQYLQGPGANVTATLQAHCYAAMPGITAKQCSPARGLYRAMGHGANANGHTRYPAQTGKAYAYQLQNAFDATAQGKTPAQVKAHAAKAGGVRKAWAAANRGARQAKGQQAKAKAPKAKAQAPADATAQAGTLADATALAASMAELAAQGQRMPLNAAGQALVQAYPQAFAGLPAAALAQA